jgi:hypothetical protein
MHLIEKDVKRHSNQNAKCVFCIENAAIGELCVTLEHTV